jgi:hypothetical protein
MITQKKRGLTFNPLSDWLRPQKRHIIKVEPVEKHIDLTQQRQVHLMPYPDVRRQAVKIEDVTRVVLFDLLRKNLHHFEIHERVGRIVLASYQPHNQHDPVLPVPVIRLNDDFADAYRSLANVLSAWVDAMFNLYYHCERYNNYAGYLHRMPPKPTAVITEHYTGQIIDYGERALYFAERSQQFTQNEWEYFRYQMRLSMSKPDRFLEYNSPKTIAIWAKAVAYNIELTKR